MKMDKIRLYFLEILLLVILFVALLVSNKITYIILALVLLGYLLLVKFLLKKKKIFSIYKKQVVWLMVGFGIIYLGFFYLIGFIINDFVKQPILFNFITLYRYIIPMGIIIVASELIREAFLSSEGKIRILKKGFDLSKILTFINMVLMDLILYIGVYDFSKLNDFLTVLGFILFASISCNLFYNYVSNRFGTLGVILYRMITILYTFIIPVLPNVYIYFRSFLRMIYPYILYLILEHTYSKADFVVSYKEKKKNVMGTTILLIIMILVTMLVSCKFKYGILVIGSGSMTGSINKGDAIIYERYDDQKIETGTVIVFESDDIKVIHRVVNILNVNGEMRYYTKGDANKNMDSGYRTDADIVGITKLKIMYIGYPSLFIRELFS